MKYPCIDVDSPYTQDQFLNWMHSHEQDAKERVRQMKARKLQSLQKQIEKLNESDCSRIRNYSQLRI